MSKHSHDQQDTLGRSDVVDWIRGGPTTDLITKVEAFGRTLQKKGLSTSQIRQVFTRLKAIEAKGYNQERKIEFLMLKPHLAYASGRHTSVKPLKKIIDWGIDEVVESGGEDQIGKFKNFCKLFEAILAYHRAHGGK